MKVVGPRPSSSPKVTVVVPARNEARNLEIVLPTLPVDAEVIVVDGHSVDDTAEVVARVRPDARLLQQSRRGKGNALAVGFAAATGDIIVMFDADGSADVAEIPRFVAALLAGADFAKGSRVMTGGGSTDITLLRDTGNKVLTGITNIAFRTRYTDLCYGYNAFWADVLPLLDLPDPRPEADSMLWGDGFEIETVINCRVARAGLEVVEVPSMELERQFGESNLNAFSDGIRVFRTLCTERFRRPVAPAAAAATHAHSSAGQAAPRATVPAVQIKEKGLENGEDKSLDPGGPLGIPEAMATATVTPFTGVPVVEIPAQVDVRAEASA